MNALITVYNKVCNTLGTASDQITVYDKTRKLE